MKKFVLFLFLIGCNFKPIFSGTDTDIYVAPISGINGIELRNSLNAKFGGMHDNGAKYNLTVNLNGPVTQYKALDKAGGATWQEVKLTASYVLKDGNKEIARGKESAAESYTFASYLVASNASYNNAVLNTIRVLSEKISMRVIAETDKYQN
jgi:Predicted secreted (periplasmic) protein